MDRIVKHDIMNRDVLESSSERWITKELSWKYNFVCLEFLHKVAVVSDDFKVMELIPYFGYYLYK